MFSALRTTVILVVAFLIANDQVKADAAYKQQRQELRQIKKRIFDDLTMRALPAGSPQRRRYLDDLDRRVTELLTIEGGYWSEYPDVNSPKISHNGFAFYDVLLLGKAYRTDGSRFFESKTALKAIEDGLRHFATFVPPKNRRPHNWWAWDIGIPNNLIPVLMLVGDALPSHLLETEFETLKDLLDAEDDMKMTRLSALPAEPFHGKTDMNALWHARLRLELAVLIENPAMAGKWAYHAFGEMVPPGAGSWQADYSYKFHGQNPMWTYGNVFIFDYATMIRCYGNTSFGPTDQQVADFCTMAERYYEGFLYKGRICPAIIGRTTSRRENPHFDVHGPLALTALASIAQTDYPRAKEFAQLVARDKSIYTALQVHQERVDAAIGRVPEASPAPPTDDIFAYPDSDFLQITRPDWAVGIKMHSTRNAGYESINQENLQGWFLSHGSTFHYITGREWDGCWPTLDWTRLPGTTVAVEVKKRNHSSFAGVIRASKDCALAAVELKADSFLARKSWLVERHFILCVGSDITGPGRVETTVFNFPGRPQATVIVNGRPLRPESFGGTVKADWCWLDSVGYVFLSKQELRVVRETRTSDYTSIRGAALHGKGETKTHHYMTGVIPHSTESDSYAYVMIPHAHPNTMRDWTDRIRDRYSIKTVGGHHVVTSDRKTESVVLWDKDEIRQVRADRGCMLLSQNGKWHLVDPNQREEALFVDAKGQSYHVTPSRGRPVVLD
jgi:hyaluronate lyase